MRDWYAHVFHIFPVRCPERDRLQKYLAEAGIQTIIHYPIPPHKQECYKEWNSLVFPITETIHAEELSLPMSPVMSDVDMEPGCKRSKCIPVSRLTMAAAMDTQEIKKEQEGYQTAFKATALFGGVQVINILVSILKSKIVALWLGTTGFGIMSLFNSATSLIYSITNLGLQDSAVRDIAYAKGQNNLSSVARTVKAINRWIWATGLFGALVTIVLAPWLSQWLFESNKYVLSFVLLSCVVLLSGIYNGNYATLQGTRNLRLMAKANIFGAVTGFLCSLPMFYFFRDRGIVWALILTALSTTVVSLLYVKKANIPDARLTYGESYHIGLKTVKLGVMMSLSGISVTLVQFVVKTFIARTGSIADVGLYQAGWALNGTYLGLVFTAMAKDYYPRLSQACYG